MKNPFVFCFLLLFYFFITHEGYAQGLIIKGKVLDSSTKESLIGAIVIAKLSSDTAVQTAASSNIDGLFELEVRREGEYRLTVSYIGYQRQSLTVEFKGSTLRLNDILLNADTEMLKEVTIEGEQTRVKQLGDTTQVNADAFKVNVDASAEDLISKMPGITNDGTGLKVNGEELKQVLVDGKPFFGEDPSVVLKNLPAEVIDKIQIFDRMSDQSAFSGFDDGQARKTMNIITKPEKRVGSFGKVYGGYGSDNRYESGFVLNSFNGDRKISLLGMSNNVNQQNFSDEDLVGATGGGRPRRGRRGQQDNNFSVGNQGGISRTHSLGLNYSDKWGEKLTTSLSYFFNNTLNERDALGIRNFITAQDSGLVFDDNSFADSDNYNQRFNGRFEWNPDSSNSIIFIPRFSWQNNESATLNDILSQRNNLPVSSTATDNVLTNKSVQFANNLIYNHRFGKQGRTISLNLRQEQNTRNGQDELGIFNRYFLLNDSLITDQRGLSNVKADKYSASLTFTEQLAEFWQMQLSYTSSYDENRSDRNTYVSDNLTPGFTRLDSNLSNSFFNTYSTQRAGLGLRFNKGKFNGSFSLEGQYAELRGNQSFPRDLRTTRTFRNLLPRIWMNIKVNETKNIRISYRTTTNPPTMQQLQDVVDNTNPLQLRSGNPNLDQSFTHSIFSRYGGANSEKSSGLFFLVFLSYTEGFVSSSTFIPSNDTTLANGILLRRGSQFVQPVNLNGNMNGRAFMTYSKPLSKLKSTLNLSSGITFNRLPALINNQLNLAYNYGLSQGIVLSSNISERIDFTLSSTSTYTLVENSLQKNANNNFFNQLSTARLNWFFFKNIYINSQVSHTLFAGLSNAVPTQFILWNGGLGAKWGKGKSWDFRLNVFDILGQNNSIGREITETFIEDTQTDVLTRYVMGTLTYTFRKFSGPPERRPAP
jgi:hypothetical protein